MLHLRLGDIEAFPFIEPPDGKAIKDGFTLLQELSAVNREGQLTPLGRQLARLPIDPRLGRMLLEAAQQGSLEEVLTVASALSVQDPRERPVERQQAADQAHAQWKDPDSDFAALINLWRGFEEQRQALGSNALRSWCRKNFLNYLRLREWRDAHRQLTLICRELKLPFGRPAKAEARKPEAKKGASADNEREVPGIDYAAVHKAILSGLLSQIGRRPRKATTSALASDVSGSIRPAASLASARNGSWPRNWWRPPSCSPEWSRRSSRTGWSRWLGT